MDEMTIVNDVISQEMGDFPDQIWGTSVQDELGDNLKVTIVLAGLEQIPDDQMETYAYAKNETGAHTHSAPRASFSNATSTAAAQRGRTATAHTDPATSAVDREQNKPEVSTLVQPATTKKRVSIGDLDNEETLASIEKPIPGMVRRHSDSADAEKPSTLVSGDPQNIFIHNSYIHDTVD